MTPKIFIAVVAVLSSSAVLSAQQSRSNPYAKLFEAGDVKKAAMQQQVQDALRQAQAQQQRPRVVCGMTLLPADPTIDPKMAIEPPSSNGVRHTIRAIVPPTCWTPEAERK